jgi:23S rRNA pseudouridine1911/1915/1917 synthase
MLHAWRLGFSHPADGRALSFEAPLPDDMALLLDRLRSLGKRNREGHEAP